MDWKRDCVAVIPCCNEAEHIGRVVLETRRHVAKVLVVDDGSTDATAELASFAGAEVLPLPNNSGKGAALRHGWKHARSLGFQWAVMLDGDGQHTAEEIPHFFNHAEKTGARLIVGNRMNDTTEMPLIRRCANRLMSRWISNLVGTNLPDSQCGFRLAHLETLLNLSLSAKRFEIESAMLVGFLEAGENVEFVPVRTIYKHRASKIDPLMDTLRWLRWRLVQRVRRTQHPSLRACNTIRVP